jgi:hypothetical protein
LAVVLNAERCVPGNYRLRERIGGHYGRWTMPREPRTLYVLTGTGFDAGAGKVTDAYLRWVIYVPFATPESTGLSTKPAENAPWLMYPGTAGAHIMINPSKK